MQVAQKHKFVKKSVKMQKNITFLMNKIAF